MYLVYMMIISRYLQDLYFNQRYTRVTGLGRDYYSKLCFHKVAQTLNGTESKYRYAILTFSRFCLFKAVIISSSILHTFRT